MIINQVCWKSVLKLLSHWDKSYHTGTKALTGTFHIEWVPCTDQSNIGTKYSRLTLHQSMLVCFQCW